MWMHPLYFVWGVPYFQDIEYLGRQCLYQNYDCSFTILSLSFRNSMLKVESNINVFYFVILKQLYALSFSDLSYYYERLETILKSYKQYMYLY